MGPSVLQMEIFMMSGKFSGIMSCRVSFSFGGLGVHGEVFGDLEIWV